MCARCGKIRRGAEALAGSERSGSMETISSRKNEKIVRLKRLGASRGDRRAFGEFLCDGEKLLREALLHGAEIRMILTDEEEGASLPDGAPAYLVSRDMLEYVSPLKNPQHVVFSCAMPDRSGLTGPPGGPYIILENIQDPGNVGTIMRTANAFSMPGMLLVGACADPYNPKAVRASMGAVFRQSAAEVSYDGLAKLRGEGLKIYGAFLGDSCRYVRSVDLRSAAVAIGSEGEGLSAKMLSLCDDTIIIPMASECESLNAGVAAAVVMWEMRRGEL